MIRDFYNLTPAVNKIRLVTVTPPDATVDSALQTAIVSSPPASTGTVQTPIVTSPPACTGMTPTAFVVSPPAETGLVAVTSPDVTVDSVIETTIVSSPPACMGMAKTATFASHKLPTQLQPYQLTGLYIC